MPRLESSSDPRSADFRANAEAYSGLSASLRAHQQRAVDGDRDRLIERHRSRGKYLPRERIDMVVDPGTPRDGYIWRPHPQSP